MARSAGVRLGPRQAHRLLSASKCTLNAGMNALTHAGVEIVAHELIAVTSACPEVSRAAYWLVQVGVGGVVEMVVVAGTVVVGGTVVVAGTVVVVGTVVVAGDPDVGGVELPPAALATATAPTTPPAAIPPIAAPESPPALPAPAPAPAPAPPPKK